MPAHPCVLTQALGRDSDASALNTFGLRISEDTTQNDFRQGISPLPSSTPSSVGSSPHLVLGKLERAPHLLRSLGSEQLRSASVLYAHPISPGTALNPGGLQPCLHPRCLLQTDHPRVGPQAEHRAWGQRSAEIFAGGAPGPQESSSLQRHYRSSLRQGRQRGPWVEGKHLIILGPLSLNWM